MEVKKRSELVVYKYNPSVPDVQIKAKTKKVFASDGQSLYITNSTTGEITPAVGGATFVKEELVDQATFVKLYAMGLQQLAGLSSSGYKVFSMVYNELLGHKDTDLITLDYAVLTAYDKWKYSRGTFNSGINDLLAKQIIFTAVGHCRYWININYFFNGDRINVVKSYKLKAQPENNQLSLLD